ncbi:Crp/Fnr family transcriptional regulator [Longitalea arenae]|uniref:Crp/Fnr family transcriptional regulator n=1 Tax=Longitalea arenae TaxID=2812558 RepID=UPI001966E13D|nr:Crp/Fnr family transcriptional regulator [Longitalea arenae]
MAGQTGLIIPGFSWNCNNFARKQDAVIENLTNHIRKFCPIEAEKIHLLESYFEHRTYRKKEVLLSEGQRCHEKYFIVKGCVHLYYLKQNGVEQTTDFALENWWTSDFMAFQTGSMAQFSIRAVETTQVLCITANSQRELLKQVPELNAYFHLVFQKAYAASQIRFRLLYEFSKEELYRNFYEQFPQFVQRVPQYLLASFLGFTPEYLSEIRKKYLS